MIITTLDDIAEEIADALGVYGADKRSEFVSDLTKRMRDAAKAEEQLKPLFQEDGGPL